MLSRHTSYQVLLPSTVPSACAKRGRIMLACHPAPKGCSGLVDTSRLKEAHRCQQKDAPRDHTEQMPASAARSVATTRVCRPPPRQGRQRPPVATRLILGLPRVPTYVAVPYLAFTGEKPPESDQISYAHNFGPRCRIPMFKGVLDMYSARRF